LPHRFSIAHITTLWLAKTINAENSTTKELSIL
jgi:hypothetical protein